MLELINLQCHYGQIHALKGLDLKVEAGEIVTIIGANGAGKSTTLQAISGLVRPSAGDILFEGTSTLKMRPDEIVRRGIGHCPEGRRIFAELTVSENLELGAFTRNDRKGIDKDRDMALGLFPVLSERARQLGGTLSGGEQQMLAIARALMSRPKLLLLDEPSLGLAPMLVKNILSTIERIRAEGVTVLLVEQNARMALTVADRAYVMESGTITMHGPSAELAKDKKVITHYLGGE